MTFWKWNDNLIVLFELWRSILRMDMFYCKNWPCDIVIKLTFFLIFLVVSYSQCNVLTGHHCVLEIIWSVISWYLSYHLSFQKNMGVLNFFLCVYITHIRVHYYISILIIENKYFLHRVISIKGFVKYFLFLINILDKFRGNSWQRLHDT